MDYNYLLTNGCSFTWGGALDDHFRDENGEIDHDLRKSLCWPHHLCKLANIPNDINLSQGCGSNQRIFRTTSEWLMNQSPGVLSKTLAIIQLTEHSRYEVFDTELNTWVAYKVDCARTDDPVDTSYYEEVMMKYNDHRLSMYTETEGLFSAINYGMSITNLLNFYGVKHYFVNQNSVEPDDVDNVNLYDLYCTSINWLHHNQPLKSNFGYYSTINDPVGIRFDQISREDTHPTITGHKQIAQHIYDHLTKT